MVHKHTPSCLDAAAGGGRQKQRGKIAQGHFVFLRSLGVNKAIFLRDNQRWSGQKVGDRGGGGREGQQGAK